MRPDRLAILTLRVLAISFAVVGTQFLLAPDATLASLDATGAYFGDFPATPATGARLWLALSVAYMLLVTLLALLAQRDLARARPYLALLVAGKASSSLVALLAYRTVSPAFPYLANFAMDGTIALGVTLIWVAAPRLAAHASETRRRGDPHALACRCGHPARRARGARSARLGADGGDGRPLRRRRGRGLRTRRGRARRLPLVAARPRTLPFLLPPLWLRRFSTLALEDRVRVLRAWEDSRLWPRRQALAALKLVTLTHVYGRPGCCTRSATRIRSSACRSPARWRSGRMNTENERPGDIEERADVAVIGTGAGGAVVAAKLAAAGADVVVLEEGAYPTACRLARRRSPASRCSTAATA